MAKEEMLMKEQTNSRILEELKALKKKISKMESG
jgi:hypothetical protein